MKAWIRPRTGNSKAILWELVEEAHKELSVEYIRKQFQRVFRFCRMYTSGLSASDANALMDGVRGTHRRALDAVKRELQKLQSEKHSHRAVPIVIDHAVDKLPCEFDELPAVQWDQMVPQDTDGSEGGDLEEAERLAVCAEEADDSIDESCSDSDCDDAPARAGNAQGAPAGTVNSSI